MKAVAHMATNIAMTMKRAIAMSYGDSTTGGQVRGPWRMVRIEVEERG